MHSASFILVPQSFAAENSTLFPLWKAKKNPRIVISYFNNCASGMNQVKFPPVEIVTLCRERMASHVVSLCERTHGADDEPLNVRSRV